jgi:hypothetical protein
MSEIETISIDKIICDISFIYIFLLQVGNHVVWETIPGFNTFQVKTGRWYVFVERPIEPNMGPSLADDLLCTFESTNALQGFLYCL